MTTVDSSMKYIPPEGGLEIGSERYKERISKKLATSMNLLSYPPTQGVYSLDKVSNILSSTIKGDILNKKILFLSFLLNYTEEDQQNIGLSGQSSSGKTWLALEVAKYFPKKDVLRLGYTSPKAFFHELGKLVDDKGRAITPRDEYVKDKLKLWEKTKRKPEKGKGIETWKKEQGEARKAFQNQWNKTKKTYRVNLHQRIIVFLDQPHDQLLKDLRSLLSHDEKHIQIKITDKTKSGGHKTKTVELVGYPTVIFNTTKYSLDEQEQTRLFLLSPEITQTKLKGSIDLLSRIHSNRGAFKEQMAGDEKRQMLKSLVKEVKEAKIKQILIHEEEREWILKKFSDDHQIFTPRHQRDFPRLLALCKAHALLNFKNRDRTEEGDVWTTKADLEAGYNLYSELAPANELGLSPEVFQLYQKKLKPIFEKGLTITRRNLAKAYFELFKVRGSSKRIISIVNLLVETGLAEEVTDPNDRRVKVLQDPMNGER